MSIPSPIPNPCSPHDEVLKQLEAAVSTEQTIDQLRACVRQLITELRQVERHRVFEIYQRHLL